MNDKMTLMFQIQPSSGMPIYRQIMNQVNRFVMSGYLKPGDELPSIRQVAGQLAVNQMTISKAYSLLEATGVLERNRGKRMVIASGQGLAKSVAKRLELVRPALVEAAVQANQMALPRDVILKEFEKLLEEDK